MKFLLIITTYLFTLYAQNPSIYSPLANIIYNNSEKINNLSKIKEYNKYKTKLKIYNYKVNLAKINAYKIDNYNLNNKVQYYNKIKELSLVNDFFVRTVKINFLNAIKNKNTRLFVQMIDSGLLDTEQYKNDILHFYFRNKDQIVVTKQLNRLLLENKNYKNIINAKIINENLKIDKKLNKIKIFSKDIEDKNLNIKDAIHKNINKN